MQIFVTKYGNRKKARWKMIDNLKEAISHAKEVAEKLKNEAEIIKKTEKVRFKIRSKFSESLHNSSGADFDVGNIDLTEYNECLECAKDHEQLAAWLTELTERREAERWNVIHTEADLPKESGFYLATVEYVDRESGKLQRTTSELCFSTKFGKFLCEENVIAWKPMPKFYTESETV